MTKSKKNPLSFVEKFKTKNKEGFIHTEIIQIVEHYKKIKTFNEDKFWDALTCNTGLVKNKEFITYPWDIVLAVKCGLENRDKYAIEFD